MFKIVTDSTADLPASYLEENQIGCMNLSYIVEGKAYGNGEELPWQEFYASMRNGLMPTTSQVNPEEAKEYLTKYISKYNEILYLAFSSGLSGTYNSGRIAAEEIMEEHPEVTIRVVDTLAASLGEGLIVYKAVELKNQGKSMTEVADWVEAHLQNFVHVFTVDDLFHLSRGGRLSKAAAVVGTLAGIKPRLYVDAEGHLTVVDKVRGRKKALGSLVDYMEAKMGSYKEQNDIVFISHGDSVDDAQFVADMIKERFGMESFMINHIGPTIGSHAGPGTIALFFLGESR